MPVQAPGDTPPRYDPEQGRTLGDFAAHIAAQSTTVPATMQYSLEFAERRIRLHQANQMLVQPHLRARGLRLQAALAAHTTDISASSAGVISRASAHGSVILGGGSSPAGAGLVVDVSGIVSAPNSELALRFDAFIVSNGNVEFTLLWDGVIELPGFTKTLTWDGIVSTTDSILLLPFDAALTVDDTQLTLLWDGTIELPLQLTLTADGALVIEDRNSVLAWDGGIQEADFTKTLTWDGAVEIQDTEFTLLCDGTVELLGSRQTVNLDATVETQGRVGLIYFDGIVAEEQLVEIDFDAFVKGYQFEKTLLWDGVVATEEAEPLAFDAFVMEA